MKRGFEILQTRPASKNLNIGEIEDSYSIELPPRCPEFDRARFPKFGRTDYQTAGWSLEPAAPRLNLGCSVCPRKPDTDFGGEKCAHI